MKKVIVPGGWVACTDNHGYIWLCRGAVCKRLPEKGSLPNVEKLYNRSKGIPVTLEGRRAFTEKGRIHPIPPQYAPLLKDLEVYLYENTLVGFKEEEAQLILALPRKDENNS